MRKNLPNFEEAIDQAAAQKLLQPHDVEALKELVSILCSPWRDIQSELEGQPQCRAVAGYYYRQFARILRGAEAEMERTWGKLYVSLHSAMYSSKAAGLKDAGKFTEKLVNAKAQESEKYVSEQANYRFCRYLSDVFYELREAFADRSRLLEQFSNNARLMGRGESEEQD